MRKFKLIERDIIAARNAGDDQQAIKFEAELAAAEEEFRAGQERGLRRYAAAIPFLAEEAAKRKTKAETEAPQMRAKVHQWVDEMGPEQLMNLYESIRYFRRRRR